jgi:hypothetical protein
MVSKIAYLSIQRWELPQGLQHSVARKNAITISDPAKGNFNQLLSGLAAVGTGWDVYSRYLMGSSF